MVFGRKQPANVLEPPPIAETDPEAVEVLRVWASPSTCQQVTLRITWEEPATWGLMLVDVARHAARAYAREGLDYNEVLERIKALFDAEWEDPTDEGQDVTDEPSN